MINARSSDSLEQTAKSIRSETGVDVIPIAADITTEAGREAVLNIVLDGGAYPGLI